MAPRAGLLDCHSNSHPWRFLWGLATGKATVPMNLESGDFYGGLLKSEGCPWGGPHIFIYTYTWRLRFYALAFGAFCFGRRSFNFKLPITKSCSGSQFRRRRLSHPTDAVQFLARAPRNGKRGSTVCKYVRRGESLRM